MSFPVETCLKIMQAVYISISDVSSIHCFSLNIKLERAISIPIVDRHKPVMVQFRFAAQHSKGKSEIFTLPSGDDAPSSIKYDFVCQFFSDETDRRQLL